MNCVDCEKQGDVKTALRLISPKIGVCDAHYRERFNQPPIVSTRERKEPKSMLSEQKIVELREDRATLPLREVAVAEKHGVSINTVQKYTMGVDGPKGAYRRKNREQLAAPDREREVRFVSKKGNWVTIENALEALYAEKKQFDIRAKKLDAAIKTLEDLVKNN